MEFSTTLPSWRTTLLFITQVLLLCTMGFYNNYPIVYPDTGMYLRSGFELFVPEDRPIFYGLFIRFVSLGQFLWFIPLAQATLVAWLLNQYYEQFLPGKQKLYYSLLLLIPLLLCTGLSFHVSQLIPDIFTPILLLALGLILFTPAGSLTKQFTLSLIVIISITMHNAHFLLAFSLLTVFSFLCWWLRKTNALLSIRKILWAWLLLLAAFLLSIGVNYKLDNRLSLSKGSRVFQMLHLVELGIAQEYMNEHCGERNFKFCQYRDSIPFDFVWDPASPLYKTGGWEANREEYGQMEREILSTPKYFILYCAKSVEYTFRQFFSFQSGDAPPAGTDSSPHVAIEKHFKKEVRQFDLSLQNLGRLNFDDLNNRQFMLVFVSGLLLLFFFFHPHISSTISPGLRWFALFILLGMLLNSCLCGTFATVVPRYQSRLIWLLPLLLMLVLAQQQTRALLLDTFRKFFTKDQDK